MTRLARHGLTLMELLIALVILCGSVAVLGELTRHSLRDARNTQNTLQAELFAESILTRCLIGEIELLPVADQPLMGVLDTAAYEDGTGEPRWLYSLDISTVHDAGLLELIVTVRENRPPEKRPTICVLARWMIDPDVENPPEEDEETTSEEWVKNDDW